MIFLPMIGYTPAMSAAPIHVVWVDTSRDRWSDKSGAYQVITDTLDWWTARSGISLTYTESAMTTDVDVNATNVCRDWDWTPNQIDGPTLLMVAYEPTLRILQCDGAPAGDATVPMLSIVWGGIRAPELAHTIGHVYGALHTTDGDIMDITPIPELHNYVYWYAYADGIVSDRTRLAVGLN